MKSYINKKESLGRSNSFFFNEEKKHTFFNSNDFFSSPINTTPVIQPKLSIRQFTNKFEKVADLVADSKTDNNSVPVLQQKNTNSIFCKGAEYEKKEKQVQRKSENNAGIASSLLSAKIKSSSGKGNGLPAKTLTEMNSSFADDFRDVHIHNDGDAVKMSKELNAQAFTHGNDIYFNTGKYDPGTESGKHLLAHELAHVVQQGHTSSSVISRKISTENPDNNIPNPSGTGVTQTNVETVLDYLSKLCPDTAMVANKGEIELADTGFCLPSVKQQDGTFKSPSELSAHPVSCECVCEMMMDPLQNITIRIDDSNNGNASTNSFPGGAIITVPSPNMTIPAIRGATGKSISSPHFIVLGHELCGHNFLSKRGVNERENTQNIPRGGHDPAINRENLVREEHGLEKRGTFRDPCCGLFDSTEQDLKKSSGKCGDDFEKTKDVKGTVANECKHWRDEYNKQNGTSFTTDDVIPEKPAEKLPATWRIEVFFKKDMPQVFHTLDQSLTPDGKEQLEVVTILLTRHPEFNAQLSGNASSDKPASDTDYNRKLAKRRAEFIFQELLRKGFDEQRFKTFDSDCEKLQEGVHNCSDDVSEKKSNELDRNVEVKLFN